jgi:hypothetical protein
VKKEVKITRKSLATFAVLSSILLVAQMFAIVQIAHADGYEEYCVCDHYENEAWLGTIYDMWTASALSGYYSSGNYFDTIDEYWQSGYGSNLNEEYVFPAVPPLDCYWARPGSSGHVYNYSTGQWDDRVWQGIHCYGYYLDVFRTVTGGTSTSIYTVSATNTFEMPYFPGNYSENPSGYYTQYGNMCTIEAPGWGEGCSLITQSSQSSSVTETSQSSPMFNVKVSYAFVGLRTQHLTLPNHMQSQILIDTLNAASLYPSLICLDVVKTSNSPIEPCNAQIEVYQIQVTTDTGVKESYIYTIGTNVNPAFSNASQLTTLRPYIADLFNSQGIDNAKGYFFINSTIGQSISGTRSGSLGKYQSNPSTLGFWTAGQPNAVEISIQRSGYILLKDDSISVVNSDAHVVTTTQVQLEKSGNGFLFNTAIPQERLQMISNPFNPPL